MLLIVEGLHAKCLFFFFCLRLFRVVVLLIGVVKYKILLCTSFYSRYTWQLSNLGFILLQQGKLVYPTMIPQSV